MDEENNEDNETPRHMPRGLVIIVLALLAWLLVALVWLAISAALGWATSLW